MRVGLQHVRQSPRMKVVLLRIFLFFLQSTGVMALLPLMAATCTAAAPAPSRDAGCHRPRRGRIVACMRRLARALRRATVRSSLRHAAARARRRRLRRSRPTCGCAAGMVVAGMAWISPPTRSPWRRRWLPDWVRARGMSIYQMALMGGAAAGSRCGARSRLGSTCAARCWPRQRSACCGAGDAPPVDRSPTSPISAAGAGGSVARAGVAHRRPTTAR